MLKNYVFVTYTFIFSFVWGQTSIYEETFDNSSNAWVFFNSNPSSNCNWTTVNGSAEVLPVANEIVEAWIISPFIDLSNQQDAFLMFDYWDEFMGEKIELLYSSDYSGNINDINLANWDNLPLKLLDMNSINCFTADFNFHPAIPLGFQNNNQITFAFRYKLNSGVGKHYKIDNFRISSNYYSGLEDAAGIELRCDQLKTAIFNKIKVQKKVLKYTDSEFDVWDGMLHTDTRLNDSQSDTIMWDMFTDYVSNIGETELDPCLGRDSGNCPGGEGHCYQREHSFPKSWWGGGSSTPADTQYTDMHHLVPADKYLNIVKSNFPPGLVESPVSVGTNGFKVGLNSFYSCVSTMKYFEPIDEYKGDYARIYFFMITRYENQIASWTSLSNEGDCALDGQSFPGFEPWLIQLLLTWHTNDPVSAKEIYRNNAVYAIQGNRNPFIDHPEWVEYIWGTSSGINCFELGVKNDQLQDDCFTITPNPASGNFNIKSTSNLKEIICLNTSGIDITDQIVVNKIDTQQYAIVISTPGIYFLKSGSHVERIVIIN